LLLLSQLADIANSHLANTIFPAFQRSKFHKAFVEKLMVLYNDVKCSSGDSHLDDYLKQHLFLETDVADITNDPCLSSVEVKWIEQICLAKKELAASTQKKGAATPTKRTSKRRGSVAKTSQRVDPRVSLAVADKLSSQNKYLEALHVLEGAKQTVQEHMFGFGLQEVLEVMMNVSVLAMNGKSNATPPKGRKKPKSKVARRASIGHKPGTGLLGTRAIGASTDGPKIHKHTSARRQGKIHEKMTKAQISRNNDTSDMRANIVVSSPSTPLKRKSRASIAVSQPGSHTKLLLQPRNNTPGGQKDRKNSKSLLPDDTALPKVQVGDKVEIASDTTALPQMGVEMEITTDVLSAEDCKLVPVTSELESAVVEETVLVLSEIVPAVEEPVADDLEKIDVSDGIAKNTVQMDEKTERESDCVAKNAVPMDEKAECESAAEIAEAAPVRRPRLDTMMDMLDVIAPAKAGRRKSGRVSLGTMEETMKILKEASGLTDAEIQWRLDTAKSNAYILSTEKLEMEETKYEKYLLRQAVLMKAKRYATDPNMERSLKKLNDVAPKIRTGREAQSVLGPAEKSVKTLKNILKKWDEEKKGNLKMVGKEEQLKTWIKLVPTLLEPVLSAPYPKMAKIIMKQLATLDEEVKHINEALKITNIKLDKCLAGMEMWQQRQKDAPESEGQLEKEENAWLEANKEANESALGEMRSFIPANLATLTMGELKQKSENDGQVMTTDLAIRLKEKKLLSWVITHPKVCPLAVVETLAATKCCIFQP
jgi:hypothetical protein